MRILIMVGKGETTGRVDVVRIPWRSRHMSSDWRAAGAGLTHCPVCGTAVSTAAPACPRCGHPARPAPLPQSFGPYGQPYAGGYPPPPPAAAPLPYAGPMAKAETALIFGIIGMCTGVTGVFALVFGIISLTEMRRNPGRYTNESSAIWAIVLGAFGTIAFTVGMAIAIAGKP